MDDKFLYDYCSNEGFLLDWLLKKVSLNKAIDYIHDCKGYFDYQLVEIESLLNEFVQISNYILQECDFSDWFMYYVEEEVSTYTQAMLNFIKAEDYEALKCWLNKSELNLQTAYLKFQKRNKQK